LAKAREDFEHRLADPDENTEDLIEDSLAFDLVPDDMGRVQS
jgi:hypothetical protein